MRVASAARPRVPARPMGALRPAVEALTAAGLLNNAGYLPGDEERAARAALTAALPIVMRAARCLARSSPGPPALAGMAAAAT
jgi:hypothetical protein